VRGEEAASVPTSILFFTHPIYAHCLWWSIFLLGNTGKDSPWHVAQTIISLIGTWFLLLQGLFYKLVGIYLLMGTLLFSLSEFGVCFLCVMCQFTYHCHSRTVTCVLSVFFPAICFSFPSSESIAVASAPKVYNKRSDLILNRVSY
jgi:hypothetical protein